MIATDHQIEKVLRLRSEGNLADAERLCRDIVNTAPHCAEGWHLLGVLALDAERWDDAIESIRRAIDRDGGDARHYLSLGRAQLAKQTPEAAVESLRLATLLAPGFAPAHEALGLALMQIGRPAEAEESFRTASGLDPTLIEAINNRGVALLALGRHAEAVGCFRQVLAALPDHVDSVANLARVHLIQGRVPEAEAGFRHALTLAPDSPSARLGLAATMTRTGRAAEALRVIQDLIGCEDLPVASQAELGDLLIMLGRFEAAETVLEQALTHPSCPVAARVRLGELLADQGRIDEARTHFAFAIRQNPSARLRVLKATLLPPILHSVEQIDTIRAKLTAEIEQLGHEGVRIDAGRETVPNLFFLAYHGRDDRPIHEAMARLITVREPIPLRPSRPLSGRKIRVGFLSLHFRNHTIGELMRGMIAHLPREQLTVTVLSDEPHGDATGRFIQQSADEFVALGRDVRTARERTVEADLDILIYTDLGMDPFTYAMACSRLAPVQCVTWGHPATTGLGTIDYFLSSELLETPEADAHYSERLVRLPTLAIDYERPVLEGAARSRTDLGLPSDANLYACPQSLFKLHPEFDPILAEILRRDPRGRLILLDGRHERWRRDILARFAITLPDVLDRVVFLPPMSRAGFLHLNQVVDVLLDPIHFGGGNTSYEAFAVGTPVVTWPSPHLKGRITQALYRKMGFSLCTASSLDTHVDVAVRLGTDADWRAEVRSQILTRCPAIFHDAEAPRSLARFLISAASDAVRRD